MSYGAVKVANEFLRLARASNPPVSLTPLQLIKLVYIAHGWSFHFMPEHPLLFEAPQAWQYGPVIPSLYHEVKVYGSSPVTSALYDSNPKLELDTKSKELIAAVFNAYGQLSGVQLSSMTHQPNTPWSTAWNENGKNAIIGSNSIADHYKQLAKTKASEPQ